MRASKLALLSVLLGTMFAPTMSARVVAQGKPQEAMVDVENETSYDVHVYLLQKGHMVELGFVPSTRDSDLAIPAGVASWEEPVQFVADLVGSPDWYMTDPVTVDPSEDMQFTIESNLGNSSIVVSR